MESPPNVMEAATRLAQTVSKTTIAFYQFLPSPLGDLRECRRKLFEEFLTVGGVTDTVKALIEDNNKRKGSEEYIERTRRLEEIWGPDGPMTQCNQRMDNVFADLSRALRDNAQSPKKPPWPLQQAAMADEIERIQVYKRAITTAIHADFCESDRKLDPKTQQALDMVTWLDIIETSEKQRFMSRQRQAKTCTWIFDENVCKPYHEWVSATEGFLWLRGKAGSGKSVLTAAIIDHMTEGTLEEEKHGRRLRNDGQNDDSKIEELSIDASTREEAGVEGFLAFFFCDFRDARTLRTSTVLKSLFAQFLQVEEPDLAATFPDLVQQYSDGLPPPADVETLQELLLRAMRLHEKKTIIIDGLNECNDVPTLLHSLEKVLVEKNVRLLITSRPEHVVLVQYGGRPTINLEDYLGYTSKDIRESLIKQMTAHSRLQAIPDARKRGLADSMTKKAEGSFWYSRCALDSLYICATVGQVHSMVNDLPKELDCIYDNILREVDKRSTDARTIVQMAVRWLGGTLRPMSISQVIDAVKIELGHTAPIHLNDNLTIVSEGDLLMICGDLVRLDERTAGMGLGHSTVRAYLTKSPPDERSRRYFFDAHEVHRDLALRSITYILTEDIDKTIEKSTKPTYLFDTSKYHYVIDHCPMLPYVFDGGFEHFQYITQEDNAVIDLLTDLKNQIRERPDKYRMVVDCLNDHTGGKGYEWIVEEQELVLAILVQFAPPWMVKRFLLRRPDLLKGEEKDKLLARVEKLGRSAELREVLIDTVKGTVSLR
ncbi:hypothetical protein BS17DRAFT_789189 [Gyrodon lividus]|nr:hypothetical protein BS17DRAFT_789189 [Gyrodon lividus]